MRSSMTIKQAYSKIVPDSIKSKIKVIKRYVCLNGTQMDPKDTLGQEGLGLVLLEVRDNDSNVLFFTYIEVEDD